MSEAKTRAAAIIAELRESPEVAAFVARDMPEVLGPWRTWGFNDCGASRAGVGSTTPAPPRAERPPGYTNWRADNADCRPASKEVVMVAEDALAAERGAILLDSWPEGWTPTTPETP